MSEMTVIPRRRETSTAVSTGQLGLMALLGTVGMLFAGFTSAYLVRRAGTDWQTVSLPTTLWYNTAILLLSSATLEAARFSANRGRAGTSKTWLLITAQLGVIFLAGQTMVWRQLVDGGVYLPTTPHSSFFYMLTGVHAAHLLGGLGALAYALARARSTGWGPAGSETLKLSALYWHFVGGLWVYLMVLMTVL